MNIIKETLSTKLHCRDFMDSIKNHETEHIIKNAIAEYKNDIKVYSAFSIGLLIAVGFIVSRAISAVDEYGFMGIYELVINYGYWEQLFVAGVFCLMLTVFIILVAQISIGTPLEYLSNDEILHLNDISTINSSGSERALLICKRGKLGLRTIKNIKL